MTLLQQQTSSLRNKIGLFLALLCITVLYIIYACNFQNNTTFQFATFAPEISPNSKESNIWANTTTQLAIFAPDFSEEWVKVKNPTLSMCCSVLEYYITLYSIMEKIDFAYNLSCRPGRSISTYPNYREVKGVSLIFDHLVLFKKINNKLKNCDLGFRVL